MLRQLIMLFALIIIFGSCTKETNPREVEFLFSNKTGLYIDSIFMNINRETREYKISDLDINESTDFVEFDEAYFHFIPTLYSDSLTLNNKPVIDLVCCFLAGQYRIDIVLDTVPDGTIYVGTQAIGIF